MNEVRILGASRFTYRDDAGLLLVDTTSPTAENKSLTDWIKKFSPIVRAVITRYVPLYLGSPEDLEQEIWAQFIRGHDNKSYLHIYDPRVATPKTYMWEFTRRRCMQHVSRADRTPTARALSIQSQPDDVFVVGIVDPETTRELSHDEYVEIEFADLAAKATAAIHRERQRGRRDLPWVWYLLRRGFQQDQIAWEMGLSEGTISICMQLIRDIPEVQELRTWAEEQGMLVAKIGTRSS